MSRQQSSTRRRDAGAALFIAASLIAGATVFTSAARAQESVTLKAADGVQIRGAYYAASAGRPVILLFHQAGSNRAEYAPIAPRLVKAGYVCLAIDQRAGGPMWGEMNETVKTHGHSADYEQALPDLEAALAWAKARSPNQKVIVWGSSYSASLVFLLAAQHPQDVAAVLAFSPGEYLGDRRVAHAAAGVTAPIFVTSAKDEKEISAARVILAASPAPVKVQFVPKTAGVHGSSTLRADRNPQGAEENWAAVMQFLAGLH
jgi:dienelactone hydrolase